MLIFFKVLGFEDSSVSKRSDSWSRPGSSVGMYAEHSRSQSQPLPSMTSSQVKIIATTIQAKRTRAPSDPFIDSQMPGLSHSLASSVSTLPQSTPRQQPPTPISPSAESSTEGPTEMAGLVTPSFLTPKHLGDADSESDEGDEYIRVWTAPDLSNAEYLSLIKLFPAFVSARPLGRFPVSARVRARRGRPADEEEADDADIETENRDVKHGTGRMWAGSRLRRSVAVGGWWTRLMDWMRRMFC